MRTHVTVNWHLALASKFEGYGSLNWLTNKIQQREMC